MRVIIAGSRSITNIDDVKEAWANCNFDITEVVSGCARGVDLLGEAIARHLGVPIQRFPADWDRFGPSAGPIRNLMMARYADGLIAVWDGTSKGTKHIIRTMKRHNKPVYIHIVKEIKV